MLPLLVSLLLGQYVSPTPTPAGGPQTQVLQSATVTASGSATLTGLASGEVDLVYNVVGPVSGTITFTIAASDPQHPSTTLASPVAQSSAAIGAASIGSLALVPVPIGAAVYVTWTVAGASPSIQGVSLTVTPASASFGSSLTIAPLSGGRCQNTCVGTTSTAVPATALANRRALVIQNKDTVQDVYCGPDSSVTSSTGQWLVHAASTNPGGSWSVALASTDVLYCIAATAQSNGCVSACEGD